MHTAQDSGRWATYVRDVTRGMTQEATSDATGVDQTTISRWLRGTRTAANAQTVVAFARGLGRNPLEALAAAGYISDDEAGTKPRRRVITDLSKLSTHELAVELARRAADELVAS